MKWRYSLLAVIGFILPLSQFIPWFLVHGLDISRFLSDLFANGISGFFAMDVFVSAVATIVLILHEGRRRQLPNLAIPIVGTLIVGVSFGLPLFLALRQHSVDRELANALA